MEIKLVGLVCPNIMFYMSNIKIFKEKANIISKEPVWVCFWGEYMYIEDTLLKLFFLMIKEWKSDKHIVG